MNILIYGATSRIAHECARLWARQGHTLVLCGRDADRLEPVAADLRAAAGAAAGVRTLALDTQDDEALRIGLEQADAQFGPIDTVLVAHGLLPDQAAVQRSAGKLRQAIDVNATSVAQICEALAGRMEARRRGQIAVIGSVAGDRGRQSNYAYGAAKGFVERYCQGLRNRLHPAGVQVTLIKPGPTDTPMTRGMAAPAGGRQPKLADPAQVAREIVQGMAKGRDVIYTPGVWRVIMAVIRSIPERVFVRLKL